ncbi:uncharacterized protein LOC111891525 isoform X2 [Lactuca sativa]|uniref:uncharacterized protein LOC111891525 isoform X2 n=1 Tax=Lactuca sativa TaxID=4236 RepID=UPI001C6935B0|nr:uncharacterized protein LOC111891525 isoform X2 [Lactuca sativa]
MNIGHHLYLCHWKLSSRLDKRQWRILSMVVMMILIGKNYIRAINDQYGDENIKSMLSVEMGSGKWLSLKGRRCCFVGTSPTTWFKFNLPIQPPDFTIW